MTKSYFIGVDVGTSSTKTGLWHVDGTCLAEASADYSLHRPSPVWAEINPLEWWRAACETIRKVVKESGVNPAEIAGVGVDGIGWSLVPVDQRGNPLFPSMIWLDRRSEANAAALRARPEAERWVNLDANPLDAAYLTPKVLWLKQHHPEIYQQTHQFLECTGFIIHKLCGVFSCDYTQAYGYHCFDIRRERWDEQVADQLGFALEQFPTLHQSCEIVGEITREAAEATGLAPGTPVIAGALDASVGAFGSGVARVGHASDQGGTAFGLSVCIDRVIVEPRLIFSHHVVPGTYIFQGGTVGGGILRWFKDTLGEGERLASDILAMDVYSVMTMEAAHSPAGANGLVFLPYMAGERSPLWNSDARGVFFGLSFNTERSDMLRALMEGCAYAVYHNVKVMADHGVDIASWTGIGGATKSALWCQIKADITNRPFTVARQRNGQPGNNTLGLAVMVGKALGIYDDLADQIEAFLPDRTVYEPSPEQHAIYERLFELYLSLSQKLEPEFTQLAQITRKDKP